jgi:hypothetical protein
MENDFLKKIKINMKALLKRTFVMPYIDYFLYKNPILKIVRLWEHGHFVDILGIKHQIHGKVIFVMSIIFLFLY